MIANSPLSAHEKIVHMVDPMTMSNTYVQLQCHNSFMSKRVSEYPKFTIRIQNTRKYGDWDKASDGQEPIGQ